VPAVEQLGLPRIEFHDGNAPRGLERVAEHRRRGRFCTYLKERRNQPAAGREGGVQEWRREGEGRRGHLGQPPAWIGRRVLGREERERKAGQSRGKQNRDSTPNTARLEFGFDLTSQIL